MHSNCMISRIVLAIAFVAVLSIVAPGSLAQSNDAVAEQVINSFKGKTFTQLYSQYKSAKPKPKAPIVKHLIVGEWRAKLFVIDDRRKLDSLIKRLQPVTDLFRVEEIDLLVFESAEPNAFGLPGVALGISTGLIARVQNDDELLAIVAHELAHDFFVKDDENEKSLSGDFQRQRQVELMCDAVAVAAMLELGREPASYSNAIRGILTYSPATQSINDGTRSHPSLSTRLYTITQLSAAHTAKQKLLDR